MRRIQLIGLIGGLSLLVTGPITATAASKVSYVRIKTMSGRLAVYSRLPREAQRRPSVQARKVSATQVFRVVQQRSGYLSLAHLGWVAQAATVKLTHVKSTGNLSIFRQRSVNAQLASLDGRSQLELTTNGPVATQSRTAYQLLRAQQLRREPIKVSKVAWTDFGEFYWLQGRHVAGWVNATQVKLKTPVTRKTVKVTKPAIKPIAKHAKPTKKVIRVHAKAVSQRKTAKVKVVTRPTAEAKARVSRPINTGRVTSRTTVVKKTATVVVKRPTDPVVRTTAKSDNQKSIAKPTTPVTANKTTRPKTTTTGVKPGTSATVQQPQPTVAKKVPAVTSQQTTTTTATVPAKSATQQLSSTTKPAQTQPTQTSMAATVKPTVATTAKQTSSKPATAKPATAKPATAKSATTNPITTKPVSTKPTTKVTTAAPVALSATMAKVNAIMTQNHFMGTLLVTNTGPSGVKIQAYGDANVANKVANTATEAYPLASLQKAVTGALVQQLINSGKLTMATTLTKFYPTLPYASQITIRQLLDHTSGIRMGEPVPATVLPDEAAALAFTLSHLTSTNQHVWSYSNANFTLLAGIISQVTGHSYWNNVQTGIIAPLNLKNMYLYNQVPANAITPASYTYEPAGSKKDNISLALLSSELGCGNLYASVGDYYTVIDSLLSGKLDGQAGITQLADNYALQYSGGIYYQAGNLVRIGGADNSFHTVYVGSNDGRVGVVLFTNQSGWTAANNAAKQILQLVSDNKQL